MPAYFDIPVGMDGKKLLKLLQTRFDIHPISENYTLKTYYDSFDWRLWRQGLICEFTRSKHSSTFSLLDRKTHALVASTALFDAPTFAQQLNPGKFRKKLEEIIEMRALLTLGTVECEASHFDIYDSEGNILLRLILEQFPLLRDSLSLLPFKGEGSFARATADYLAGELGFVPRRQSALAELLQLQGRRPKDYSSKISFDLTPDMAALLACQSIMLQLLKVLQRNEQGVIDDVDSEFLHDFRVAIRKTRVGLKQFKALLPAETLATHLAFFTWLGQITGEARDLDVALLNFDVYQQQLPQAQRAEIAPLQHFLQSKKTRVHRQLTRHLRSKKYRTGMLQWQDYLTKTPVVSQEEAPLAAKQFANRKISKLLKKTLREGGAINDRSPPEALHNLRKSCKKLRYLLEFFRDLYPESKMDKLLKHLKDLQAVLGSFQDIGVHQAQLRGYTTAMDAQAMRPETAFAVETIIEKFDRRKLKVREKFSVKFERFNNYADNKSVRRMLTE